MRYLVLIIGLMAFTSCEEKSVKRELTIPASYDASQYITNTTEELRLLDLLAELSTEMKKGRAGNQVDGQKLLEALIAFKPLTSSYYYNFIETDLLPELISESRGIVFNPGTNGGVYGAYLFNKYGIENEQRIEKGLYAAAFYQEARKLTRGQLKGTSSDKIVALFGAHPDFANSNSSSLHDNPDRFIANYVARRDKNNGDGYYTNIKNGLIKLQAAVNAGNDYQLEQEEAVQVIFENWEKGSAATAINYFYEVLGDLSVTSLDEASISSAMHSFSEILGFLQGFRTVDEKIITDEQIDEILTLLNTPVEQTPTTLNIINQPVQEVPKLLEVVSKLKSIYKFTDTEMEDFKKNWVNEQQR
ncbi:MAG: hypothetical protein ACI9IP_000164 [Arcticibacterium sp.]|jgi:hypothetical protein